MFAMISGHGIIAAKMNQKNRGKRKSASVSAVAHNRLKEMSKSTGVKIERLIDDAVFMYLKMQVTGPVPMLRGQGGE